MANNIGTTSTTLPRTIGTTMDFDTNQELTSITAISGEVDIGFMLFDNDGTMAICTGFTRDQENNPIYTFRTSTLNTEIDVQAILSQRY